MVDNASSKIRSGWYTWPFSPGRFEMHFHVQIKQPCKSEKLVVFFWYRQDQKGTDGIEIYIYIYLKVWGNKSTLVRLDWCIPNVLIVLCFVCD